VTTLVGTGSLVRLILRRDRWMLPVWVVVLSFIPIGVAGAFAGLYPTLDLRLELMATVVTNPGLVALLGPLYDPSIGGLTAWRIGTIGCVFVALMAVLTVIRHTRVEEETGRRELLGSTVIGRHAPLTAALIVVAATGLLIGIFIAAGLVATGEAAAGSIAFGLGWALIAAVFAAVGGVAAQLTANSGAARGIAVGAIGVAYLLRMAGDGGADNGFGWLTWLSPIGWFTRLRPFAGEQWWVALLSVGLVAVLVGVAYRLSSTRDVAAGVFEPRPGPATASPSLGTPLGLAWRLQRPSLLGWGIGLMLFGVVWGGIADSVTAIVDENPGLADILERLGGEQAIVDIFFSAAMGIVAYIVAAYAVRTALRLHTEETGLRAEPILATATPRLNWAGSHLTFAVLGPVLIMALVGVVTGIVYGATIGDLFGDVPRLTGSALLQVPAVWVMVGIAMTLYGLVPRLSALAWALLAGFLFVGLLGQVLQFPQWVIDLSPFSHTPTLPGDIDPVPLALLTGAAVILVGAGLAGFRRRDVI
jgi:polyether ionophore transport system permease protein